MQIIVQQKCHLDEIIIIDCTSSCQNDNFCYGQQWKFHQNDIFVSVDVFC